MSKTGMMALAVLLLAVPQLQAEDKPEATAADPMAPLARFVGGEWTVHGKWNSGQELRARSVYTWGLNRKIILAKTFVRDDKGDEYQRYEDILFWHPQQKRLLLHNFAFNGGFGETVMECPEPDKILFGFSPMTPERPSKLRQTIVFRDEDTFTWKVEMLNNGKWDTLIDATWKRQTTK